MCQSGLLRDYRLPARWRELSAQVRVCRHRLDCEKIRNLMEQAPLTAFIFTARHHEFFLILGSPLQHNMLGISEC